MVLWYNLPLNNDSRIQIVEREVIPVQFRRRAPYLLLGDSTLVVARSVRAIFFAEVGRRMNAWGVTRTCDLELLKYLARDKNRL